MATARTIHLSTEDSGVYRFNPRAESALKASQLLQQDLKSHHIFFNEIGFHNHIVHHLLSIFALGATPEHIQTAFDRNSAYQRPALPADEGIVRKLSNKHEFRALAGKRDEYPHFLEFFQREIDSRGIEATVNEYLFNGDDFADEMLARAFGGKLQLLPLKRQPHANWVMNYYLGLLHPFIHLGFGLEFKQPAIVAQALAQAAVHESTLKGFFMETEAKSGGVGNAGTKNLVDLQNECRADPCLRGSSHWSDTNKVFDGVLKRAPEEMIKYASQFTVETNQINERLAEQVNAVVYYTGTAQNPPKKIKFDFFYIHCVNSAIFLPVFISLPWISKHNKQRLLEWKGRMDLLVYVSRACPEPRVNEIINYKATKTWQQIFEASFASAREDGHAAKLMRTLAYGEQSERPSNSTGGFPVKGDMWAKLGNMVADSIQGPEEMWVRSSGFVEAWKDIPDRF
ncbi:hypothetical protein LOZ12_000297 [Ophidiomyces ophidiicola]|uniref:uncharacterized protein n=1 Tax=Ophidiomyces ophidiicola TaxID=1387563 RepID=UPI0020C4484A|nr:uncharacterized protein LOZ57_000750 [Ophidiomyces ophidiicola]KAI1952671.1 hypothetical protein LOZ57_000750 [Ophidiomyces ophidiicola]KAI2057135.1 hypothetical protein LOZ44_001653 [Ophidiomyces ophidiicola]KAI2164696.1 hypothetical protein LOZ26_001065 [Ophidiomyces ophidiicola]KAI2180807.1 hypothetical protein LOZ24_001002 [Ophidiomyces ophidiicola]KAI2221696.1 hypothetical protein LOZ17_002014 [Ophidiomyces ophidiicola]